MVNVGSQLDYVINVTNLGSSTATDVIITNPLPASATFLSATPSQGSCVTNNGKLICSLGSLPSGNVATVNVSVIPTSAGALTNFAFVVSGLPDFGTSNNVASAVALINAYPTISLIADQSTFEGISSAAIPFSVSDMETAPDSLLVTGLSSNTNLVPNTNIVLGGAAHDRSVILNPAPNVYGTSLVMISVSDGYAVSSTTFLLTVLPVNHAPVLSEIPNQVVDEGTLLTFTNSASDADLPAQALTFSLINAPPGAAVDPTNGVFSWVPSETQGPSTNYLTIMVMDDGLPALSAARTFAVIVNEVNAPPALEMTPDQTITENQPLIITNTAFDPDIPANNLTFTLASNAPIGATIDPTNGVFSWTPVFAQAQPNTISVIVTDNGSPPLSATQNFFITVIQTNMGRTLPPIPEQYVFEGQTLVVTNLQPPSEITNNSYEFTLASSSPAGALLDATNGVFSWTPTEAQGPGTNLIVIYEKDSFSQGGSVIVTQTFYVVVLETNSAPMLSPIPNFVIHAGSTVIFSNSAADSDIPANTITFTLEPGAPAGAALNSSDGLFTYTTGDGDVGSTNVITIRATDDGVPPLSDTRTFSVTVMPRPEITSIMLTNGLAQLVWTAIPGTKYRVQYLDNLESLSLALWTDLPFEVLAMSELAQFTDPTSPSAQRFYRVLMVQ